MEIQKLAFELAKFTQEENICINEPMQKHTTFKVGGPADILVEPIDAGELCNIVKYLKNNRIQFIVIGNGSNLIVRDKGIRGVVIKLFNNFKFLQVDGNVIRAGAGGLMSSLARVALTSNLTGLEFASGIPGTVGGGVTMNAGAYGGEISHILKSCRVLDGEGNLITLDRDQMKFGYRKTVVQEKSYIVLEAAFQLIPGDYEKIKALIEELNSRRRDKQPLEYPSAGSVFKRPEGYFAGKLIQDSNLRGYRIGDAAVSEKHAGFIINLGNATCKDILDLIHHIQDTVEKNFGVMLETEVKIIGQE